MCMLYNLFFISYYRPILYLTHIHIKIIIFMMMTSLHFSDTMIGHKSLEFSPGNIISHIIMMIIVTTTSIACYSCGQLIENKIVKFAL